MLTEYIAAVLHHARYKLLDDGTDFGEVPELPGTWANAATLEDCREELREVVEAWIAVGLNHGAAFPVLDGVGLQVTEVTP